MAKVIEKNIITTAMIEETITGFTGLPDIIDFSKIKLTPTIITIALSPLLFLSPLKNIVRNGLLLYVLYSIAKKYEETGKIL